MARLEEEKRKAQNTDELTQEKGEPARAEAEVVTVPAIPTEARTSQGSTPSPNLSSRAEELRSRMEREKRMAELRSRLQQQRSAAKGP